jgi:putative polyhydroxyalkanoate system protein
MPNLTISIPHQVDRTEARKRTEECIAHFRQQYGGSVGQLTERWDGDTMTFSFAAMGASINGQAHVEDRAVRLEVELPWILSMLAGGIKKSIEQQGRKLLGAR